ncbi:hypothetical protein BH10PSE16_BH10PSE16_05300 [soil metagenome]
MHQSGQQAAHQALMAHETAAQNLRAASSPADLLRIHANLMVFYVKSPIRYWQQIATTSLQSQIEMMAGVNRMFIGKTHDRLEWTLSSVQADLPAGEESFESQPNVNPHLGDKYPPTSELQPDANTISG